MPTFQWLPRFDQDLRRLTKDEREEFMKAVRLFVNGLKEGRGRFHRSLRVHRLDGTNGVWSISWGDEGRATFHYSQLAREGEAHIVWRRVGTHAIYRQP